MSAPIVRGSACLVFLMVLTPHATAQEPLSRAEVAAVAKPATALVEVKTGSGSGFCIHASGLFVTNEHVVKSLAPDGTALLVLDAGRQTQRILKAKVIRRDKDLDLALLHAEGDHKLSALQLASDDKLGELTELIAFGFPFGKALGKSGDYPAITVNVVNVSALRTDAKGDLHRIQLDSNLNPGNSGGPVLDRSGKVMGVVVSGIVGAGINLAIPVRHLRRFLDRPVIAFTPPTINAKNKHELAEFRVTATSLPADATALDLELILTTPDQNERRLAMKGDGAQYSATAIPFPAATSEAGVRLDVRYANGTIAALAKDRTFRIGQETVKLSDIRSLKSGAETEVVLASGKKLAGSLADLDVIAVMLGGQTLDLKLTGVLEIQATPSAALNRLTCVIVARKAGKEVGRIEETVYLEGTQRATLETMRDGKFLKPLPSAAAPSYLKVVSTSGDFIGQGNSYSYQGSDLNVGWQNGTVQVNVDGWKVEFAAPRGTVLAVGDYPNAQRYPFNDDTPGISFSGKGRGANKIAGRFVIWELEVKNNTIVRLAIDFVQRAEVKGPPLYGMLRYKSAFE